jgi:hypothetical protein
MYDDIATTGESDVFSFILFAGYTYYPEQGARDFVSAHTTLDAAVDAMETLMAKGDKDWAHVAELVADDLIIVKSAGMA